MASELSDNELMKMQNEAMKRVLDMQKRARLQFDDAQGTESGGAQAVSAPSAPSPSHIEPSKDLIPLLFSLLAETKDPILKAILGYLL